LLFEKDFVWIYEVAFVDIPVKCSIPKVGSSHDQQSHQLMYPSISDTKLSLSQLLARLRYIHQPGHKALAEALQMSYTTYLKTERGRRELSFLMALRICQFYKMDLHEFISMLSDEELGRNELSIMKALEKRERKKAEALKAKVIDIQT
jgi:transcriptional regulator with XRE-family HTH domain